MLRKFYTKQGNIINLKTLIPLLVATASLAYGKNPETPKPNIIYILADDLGYGDLGCYGQKLIKTPNIDKLSSEGMQFSQHYSGGTVCAPSRCVLLTGLHTGHSYIRGNGEIQPEGQRPIPANGTTIGTLMQEAGFTTACIGKWGLGGPGTHGEPNKQGFDHWFGYLCQRKAHSYYPTYLWRNGKKQILEGNTGAKGKEEAQYSHDLLTTDALAFIDENKDGPFFLYLPYTIPHTAFQVPELGIYADKDWELNHKKQAAMVTRMDRDVGTIMERLKTHGIDKNTIVIFTSDNGAHATGGTGKKFNASGPLRGSKRALYEGGIRVPMVARWPGVIDAGSTTDHVSAFWDILPTFAELTGQALTSKTDGISFLPTLVGKPERQQKHKHLYWEFYEQGGKQAIRIGNWKGVRKNVNANPNAPIELYDLEKDIGEQNNLAMQFPEVVSKIKALMKSEHSPSEIWKFKKRTPKQKAKKK